MLSIGQSGGYAHVFRASKGVGGNGHVGWGFSIGKSKNGTTMYQYGSYDSMTSVWSRTGNGKEMLNDFVQDDYDGWKYSFVPSPNSAKAEEVRKRWMKRYYFLAGSNCMNMAYDILTAFGLRMYSGPGPLSTWAPNTFYTHFPGSVGRATWVPPVS